MYSFDYVNTTLPSYRKKIKLRHPILNFCFFLEQGVIFGGLDIAGIHPPGIAYVPMGLCTQPTSVGVSRVNLFRHLWGVPSIFVGHNGNLHVARNKLSYTT